MSPEPPANINIERDIPSDELWVRLSVVSIRHLPRFCSVQSVLVLLPPGVIFK